MSLIIKVGGLFQPENIRQVAQLDVDMLSLTFDNGSRQSVHDTLSHAGFLPNRADKAVVDEVKQGKQSIGGAFANAMPQAIIKQVYNYHLSFVLLAGDETPVFIDNLRQTIVPDVAKELLIIKLLAIHEAHDLAKCHPFDSSADLFQLSIQGNDFANDPSLLVQALADNPLCKPFILGGSLSLPLIEALLTGKHPLFAGINIRSQCLTDTGLQDIKALTDLVMAVRELEKTINNQ